MGALSNHHATPLVQSLFLVDHTILKCQEFKHAVHYGHHNRQPQEVRVGLHHGLLQCHSHTTVLTKHSKGIATPHEAMQAQENAHIQLTRYSAKFRPPSVCPDPHQRSQLSRRSLPTDSLLS